MTVIALEILTDLQHHTVRYHRPLLRITLYLQVLEPEAGIDGKESTLHQIGREGAKPTQIIVPGYETIVPVDIDIVKELTNKVVVHLEHIDHITPFLHPMTENPQVTDIA